MRISDWSSDVCSSDLVTKVTRLFNNTLGDILSELIQNARRAGASAVDLKVIEADEAAFLAIVDDGAGIEDPSVILALGRSGWGDDIARREDPAGMGVFSLRSEEHTSELQSLMRISYAVFCLKKKTMNTISINN